MFFSYKDKGTLHAMITKNTGGNSSGGGGFNRRHNNYNSNNNYNTNNSNNYSNNSNYESIHRGKENLLKCIDFCTNEVDCRRQLLLEYFGEKFPRENCKKTCDNCKLISTSKIEDVTIHAKLVLGVVKAILGGGGNKGRGSERGGGGSYPALTMSKLVRLYKGGKVSYVYICLCV